MSSQTYTLTADTHLNTLFNSSMFNDETIQTFIDLDISTILSNLPLYNDPSNSPEDFLGYELLNFDQPTDDMQNPSAEEIQIDQMDHSLVEAPSAILHGSAPVLIESQCVSVRQNNLGTSTNPSISGNENASGVKNRRSRKKKAPLPPALREEKRRVFLEKNRIAARKCRERNRKKWDQLQEQCINLEAQNQALKERRGGLKKEMEGLRRLLAEHESCSDRAIAEWMERDKSKTCLKLDLQFESESKHDSIQSETIESCGASDGSQMGAGEEEDLEGQSISWVGSAQDQNLVVKMEQQKLSNNSPGQTPKYSSSTVFDMDIDMASFIADDKLPALTSRKTSAASSEFDFETALTIKKNQQFPSPADSGCELTATANVDVRYEKLAGEETEGLRIVDEEDDLVSDSNMFPTCRFAG